MIFRFSIFCLASLSLLACGGGSGGGGGTPSSTSGSSSSSQQSHTVVVSEFKDGVEEQNTYSVSSGDVFSFSLSSSMQYFTVDDISGCGGVISTGSGEYETISSVTADCEVDVNLSLKENTVRVFSNVNSYGGKVFPSIISMSVGQSSRMYFESYEGFRGEVSGCGLSKDVSEGSKVGLNVDYPGEDCTVYFDLSPITDDVVTITTSSGAGGFITPESVVVPKGANVKFTSKTGYGYEVVWSGCEGISTNSVYRVDAHVDCSVHADYFPVNDSGYLMTIVHDGSEHLVLNVKRGEDNEIVNSNFVFSSDSVTGVDIGAQFPSRYNISSVSGCEAELIDGVVSVPALTQDCDLQLEYGEKTSDEVYDIPVVSTGNGEVVPASMKAYLGSYVQFDVTPDAGYSVGRIETNGCSGSTMVRLDYHEVSMMFSSPECSLEVEFVEN